MHSFWNDIFTLMETFGLSSVPFYKKFEFLLYIVMTQIYVPNSMQLEM